MFRISLCVYTNILSVIKIPTAENKFKFLNSNIEKNLKKKCVKNDLLIMYGWQISSRSRIRVIISIILPGLTRARTWTSWGHLTNFFCYIFFLFFLGCTVKWVFGHHWIILSAQFVLSFVDWSIHFGSLQGALKSGFTPWAALILAVFTNICTQVSLFTGLKSKLLTWIDGLWQNFLG